MKVKVREDAATAYRQRRVISQKQPYSDAWVKTLEAVQGMTLEVETEYLFEDQFNTAPIEGISDTGLRLMSSDIEQVIDDARPGRMRCHWCGKNNQVADTCPNCGKADHREPFTVWWTEGAYKIPLKWVRTENEEHVFEVAKSTIPYPKARELRFPIGTMF